MPYIYVMDRANGHMKIGFSTDPFRRLPGVLGAQSVLAMWEHDDAYQVEQAAHRLLAEFRQDGEWFAVTRYRAFNAVVEAMYAHDGTAHIERVIPMDGADREIPPVPTVDPERHHLGYLCPLPGVPAGQQMKWLLASGVSDLDVYKEARPGQQLDASMKDCRDGDLFFAWSSAVFGERADAIAALIKAKGADLVTAL